MCEYELINKDIKLPRNISYMEIINFIDKDIIRPDIFDLVKSVKKYSFVRDALLFHIFKNSINIKRRIQNYLKNNKDKEIEVFYERLLDCWDGEKIDFKRFDNLLYVMANDSIFFRFLCIIFISTNDFLNIFNDTLNILSEERDFLTISEYNDILKVELFNTLKNKYQGVL